MWARAESQVEGWKSIAVRLPASAGAPVVFTINRGEAGQPQKRATLTLDGSTGEVTRWEPFSSLTPGRRLRSILRFAHTGEVLGLAGQTIAGLVSAGGAVLVYTGISLAVRRLWAAFAASSSWQLRRASPKRYAPGSIATVSSSNPDRSSRSRHERPSSERPARTDTIM